MQKRIKARRSGAGRNSTQLIHPDTLNAFFERLERLLNRPTREPPTALKVADVAARLRCSDDTVYRLIRSGCLVPFRLVNGIRIHPDELNDFCRRRIVPPPTTGSNMEDKI